MKKTESGKQKATRQCWECLKRRLVCDHTLPHCKKCQKAGKQCPGYDEQKPLQWIENGKVTSRRTKKDIPPKIYSTSPKEAQIRATDQETESSDVPPAIAPNELILDPTLGDTQIALSAWTLSTDSQLDYPAKSNIDEIIRDFKLKTARGIKDVERIFAIGGRKKIEEVVARGLHNEAAGMVQSDTLPLQVLERVLMIMQRHDLPNYGYLSNDMNEVVQAVSYYNERVYPTVRSSGELAPNPAVILFPLNALHILPPAVHHTLVCLSLNHFIYSLPIGADKSMVVANRSKIYQHRGAAIRALSHYVGKDKTRCSDLTITSILIFLSMELQNPATADWRLHANGMQKIINMRGGFRSLMKESPHLAPTLVIYVLIVVMANTCSPSWDQINLSGTPQQNINDIAEIYSLVFPYTLCPPALFLEVLRINYLRSKASAALFACEIDLYHSLEAHDLLSRIAAFIPEDWAQAGDHYEEWLLIGTIYQSAVTVYCTMALQSLTLLPNTLEMNSMRSIHGSRLLKSLRAAMKSPQLISFMMWPLTVAGVEAGFRDEITQYWIETQFAELSRRLGTSSPLKAQAVLRRYWTKTEPGWDECFDLPYVFVF